LRLLLVVVFAVVMFVANTPAYDRWSDWVLRLDCAANEACAARKAGQAEDQQPTNSAVIRR
jgi:hypothetical protein